MPYKDRQTQLKAQRQHYRKNKKNYTKRSSERRDKARRYVYDYLKTHPCIVCGESDPVVLEFDHRDPEQKDISISEAVNNKFSHERLQKEIDKCDVLCANCHRRKTAVDASYYTYLFSQEE